MRRDSSQAHPIPVPSHVVMRLLLQQEESIATIHRALELGVNMLDSADVYGPFTNEPLLGRTAGILHADLCCYMTRNDPPPP